MIRDYEGNVIFQWPEKPLPPKKVKQYKYFAMQRGGNQLAILLESYFSLAWVKQHQKFLDIDDEMLDLLTRWQSNNYSVNLTIEPFRGLGDFSRVRYFLLSLFHYGRYHNVLYRITRLIDPKPVYNPEGEIVNRLSFLEYEEYYIEGEQYRVVQTRIDRERFWREIPSANDCRKYEKTYIYRLYKGRWNVTQTQYARNYLLAMRSMRDIMNARFK